MPGEESTIHQLLCEFFEVIIHNILYRRHVYPKSIFIKTKSYGIPAFQSIHPQLNEYILETLKVVLFHLKNKTLKTLIITITTGKVFLERYVINLLEIKEYATNDLYQSLEGVFKKFCLKIETAIESLNNVPKDPGFLIHLEVTNHGMIVFNESPEYSHFPWYSDNLNDESSEIIPIYNFESENIKLDMIVEKNVLDLNHHESFIS
nr:mitotic spindle assembly checkpoint protein MAD2B [Onthophagus taurus]